MTQRRRKILYLAGLAILLSLALVAYLLLKPASGEESADTETVRTTQVTVGDVEATVSASGQLSSASTASESFGASGTIESIHVSVGDTVEKGDVLATLETSELETAVTSAEAELASASQSYTSANLNVTSATQSVTSAEQSLASARTVLKRVRAGTDKSMTVQNAKAEVTKAKAQVTSAKAQVASSKSNRTSASAQVTSATETLTTAREALAESELIATISGTVTAVNAAEGDAVGSSSSTGSSQSSSTDGSASSSTTSTSSSSAVIELSNADKLELEVSFAEADVVSLEVGQAASITFPALDGATATGELTSISPVPTTTNNVVTFTGVVSVTDLPDNARIGQSANATVVTASATDVLYVPTQALNTNEDGSYTVSVTDATGAETVTPVEIGVQGDSTVEIVSGLTEGDEIVISTDTAVSSGDSTDSGDSLTGGTVPGGGMPGGGMPGGNFGGN